MIQKLGFSNSADLDSVKKLVGGDCFYQIQDFDDDIVEIVKNGQKVSSEKLDSKTSIWTQVLRQVIGQLGIVTIRDQTDADIFLKMNKTTVLFGSNIQDRDPILQFLSVTHTKKAFKYGITFDAKVIEKHASGKDKFMLIKKKLTGQQLLHNQKFNIEEISYALDTASQPLMQNFDKEDSPSIVFGPSLPCIFLIDHHKNSEAFKIFSKAAEKFRNEINFVHADPESGIVMRLIGYLKINNELGNGVWIIKATWGRLSKYKFPYAEITEENIEKFIEAYDNGTLPKYYHSENLIEDQKEPIFEVVGSNFKEIVLDSPMHVMVDFYGTYCGHCFTFAPIYEELANRFASNKNIKFVKIDIAKNEVETEQEIHNYPTIKLYVSGKKNSPVIFQGKKILPELMDFIKNNIQDDTMEDI